MQFVKPNSVRCPFDLTPMIGIMLLLAVFLLVGLSFSLTSQDETIRLPGSELARPPATPVESPITLQLTSRGTVIFGGVEVAAGDVRTLLENQRDTLKSQGRDPARATIILRADRGAPTGTAQELIDLGQQVGFQRFVLRAKEEDARGKPTGKGQP